MQYNAKYSIGLVLALIITAVITISLRSQEPPPPAPEDNSVYVTNNVTVIMTQANDNALRVAWRLGNNARTNGIPPFLTPTNAITYREFRDQIGRSAFESVAIAAQRQNEAFFLQRFRAADADLQARIARILGNKE